jgi:hypothetical protein
MRVGDYRASLLRRRRSAVSMRVEDYRGLMVRRRRSRRLEASR